MTINRAPRAIEDIGSIWDYIAVDSERSADAVLERIDRKLRLLESNPRLGTPHDDVGDGLRSFTFGNYALWYRPIPNGVELVRVLHGARDRTKLTFD